MENKYNNLLSPLKVGSHNYSNRMVAAPIYCGTFASIPFLSDVLKQSISEKARGGYAQVTVGETPVDFEYANREPFEPVDYTKYEGKVFDALKRGTDQIRANGAFSMIELSHCGESKLFLPGLKNPIGPMGYTREDGIEVVAMDEEMMDSVCNSFVNCSKFMKAAGFDGVLIHAGHGWLLHQFLSSRINKRTDEYGGSLENRARFPRKVIQSVREAMGADFIIEIRISGEECMENGMGIEENVQFCRMIEDIADIIHVSVGVYRNPILSGEFSTIFHPHGLNASMSEAVKKAVSIPVTLVGGINSPELAEQLIADGKCDFVAMARQLTADPQFANKVKNGRTEDITPCVRCFKCFPGPLEDNIDDLSSLFGCSVNPEAFFFDAKVLSSKPESSKKVLVVGGGVGGMEAALVAADRGHQVTLVEKTDKLGGLLNFADSDYYKKDLGSFKDVLSARVKSSNAISLKMNTEVNPADLSEYEADAVIIAVGSEPVTPSIAGVENAVKALDVYDNPEKIGKKVVMIGGGLVGCEVGLHLARSGKDVTVIEMQESVSPDSYPMHRIGLINEMEQILDWKTELCCSSISKDGVTVVDKNNSEEFIPADTVVYALGMKARDEVAESLSKAAGSSEVYKVGDCVSASKVYDAVRQGYLAAMSIL